MHRGPNRESGLQTAILQYLSVRERQNDLYYARLGSGFIKTLQGGIFKSGRRGAPDIVVCHKGQFVALEVKTETGRLNPHQMEAMEAITNTGGVYAVVRSVDEVERTLASIR